jgi:hypothetical protein
MFSICKETIEIKVHIMHKFAFESLVKLKFVLPCKLKFAERLLLSSDKPAVQKTSLNNVILRRKQGFFVRRIAFLREVCLKRGCFF